MEVRILLTHKRSLWSYYIIFYLFSSLFWFRSSYVVWRDGLLFTHVLSTGGARSVPVAKESGSDNVIPFFLLHFHFPPSSLHSDDKGNDNPLILIPFLFPSPVAKGFLTSRISHKFSYLYLLVFWKSLHLEVTSDLFCFLINTHHLLIFALIIILFIFTGFNIYCWTGIYFS